MSTLVERIQSDDRGKRSYPTPQGEDGRQDPMLQFSSGGAAICMESLLNSMNRFLDILEDQQKMRAKMITIQSEAAQATADEMIKSGIQAGTGLIVQGGLGIATGGAALTIDLTSNAEMQNINNEQNIATARSNSLNEINRMSNAPTDPNNVGIGPIGNGADQVRATELREGNYVIEPDEATELRWKKGEEKPAFDNQSVETAAALKYMKTAGSREDYLQFKQDLNMERNRRDLESNTLQQKMTNVASTRRAYADQIRTFGSTAGQIVQGATSVTKAQHDAEAELARSINSMANSSSQDAAQQMNRNLDLAGQSLQILQKIQEASRA